VEQTNTIAAPQIAALKRITIEILLGIGRQRPAIGRQASNDKLTIGLRLSDFVLWPDRGHEAASMCDTPQARHSKA